jgi:hypothetical protein
MVFPLASLVRTAKDLLQEPAGLSEVPPYGTFAAAHEAGHLCRRVADQTKLKHFSEYRMLAPETVYRRLKGAGLHVINRNRLGIVKRHSLPTAAASGRIALTGVFDENAPHGFRSHREEQPSGAGGVPPAALQARKCLVHQRRRLQRVIGPFGSKALSGQLSKLLMILLKKLDPGRGLDPCSCC